jgi:hypothetical protein
MMDEQTSQNNNDNTVTRSRVFVLLDGTFVVRWQENRVQELQTGQYRLYNRRDFGAPITDYELSQLKSSGIVEAYTETQVTLCPLPEHYEIQYLTLWEQRRKRSYYLNTTLSVEQFDTVSDLLHDRNLQDAFLPRMRDGFVILWGHNGISFSKFDDAERARELLVSRAPQMFKDTVVAFVETSRRA